MNARFEVVHGDPSEEELAVVISLLAAAAGAATAAPEPVAANWSRPVMRTTPPAGPGAWWRSGLPQP